MTEALVGLRVELAALDADPDLARIQTRLEAFNVFDAVGMGSFEIRHSNFLAFLLDPARNHGLGDRFAKAMLRAASARATALGLGRLTVLDDASLDNLEVRREADFIDILLTDKTQRLAVAIENKTYSTEHGDQLLRYADLVEARYPDYRRLYLYLTPDGEEPSDSRYVPITYEDLDRELRQLVMDQPATANPELLALIDHHYLPLLRREGLVRDTELDELAANVYAKHRAAIDYIVSHDSQWGLIRELLDRQAGLEILASNPSRLVFLPKPWKTEFLDSPGKFGRRLAFHFRKVDGALVLILRLEPASDAIGQKLVAAAQAAGEPFGLKNRGRDVTYLYQRPFPASSALPDDKLDGGSSTVVRRTWEDFVANDLPRILRGLARVLEAEAEGKVA